MLEPSIREALVDAALQVQQRAYAPYSKFHVGAAVLANDGTIFLGTNVENASYGLTICAEQSAVFSAVSAGQQSFRAVAIASPGGANPCGACRQVLAEFCRELQIVLVDSGDRQVVERTLADIYPDPMRFPSLPGEIS